MEATFGCVLETGRRTFADWDTTRLPGTATTVPPLGSCVVNPLPHLAFGHSGDTGFPLVKMPNETL